MGPICLHSTHTITSHTVAYYRTVPAIKQWLIGGLYSLWWPRGYEGHFHNSEIVRRLATLKPKSHSPNAMDLVTGQLNLVQTSSRFYGENCMKFAEFHELDKKINHFNQRNVSVVPEL